LGALFSERHSSFMRVFFAVVLCSALVLTSLVGCSNKDGAEGVGAAAKTVSPTVLLLGAEDIISATPRLLATGPVVSGSLQPQRMADLRAELGAVVIQVPKDNGQPVRTGDLLVRLDDTSLRESLASADATVRAATQAMEQTERQVQRLKTLQAQGMTTLQALEDSEARRNNARSDLAAAQSRAVSARQQLRRTEVRAPFDGVISGRLVSPGDTVQMGRELLKVIDPRSMRFEGLVAADRMAELKLGQTVSFRVIGAEAGQYTGILNRIDSAANAATRQVAVQVNFDGTQTVPRTTGLFAEGRVQTGGAQVLVLPEGAVQREGENTFVWRVDAKTITRVPVRLGERDARTGVLPVLEGLSAGQRVLRNPGSGLLEGQSFEMAVQPAGVAPAGAALGAPSAAAAASAAK